MKDEQYHNQPLTEEELALLQRPVKELRELGLVPTAFQALERKFAINRTENEAVRAVEEEARRARKSAEAEYERKKMEDQNVAA